MSVLYFILISNISHSTPTVRLHPLLATYSIFIWDKLCAAYEYGFETGSSHIEVFVHFHNTWITHCYDLSIA